MPVRVHVIQVIYELPPPLSDFLYLPGGGRGFLQVERRKDVVIIMSTGKQFDRILGFFAFFLGRVVSSLISGEGFLREERKLFPRKVISSTNKEGYRK